MGKDFVTYSAAALAAKRGGVKLSADEYNGFADIGTCGVLEGAENDGDELRLSHDTDGTFDGYIALSPDSIVRSASASGECLMRRGDGAVVIKQNKSVGSAEENNDK